MEDRIADFIADEAVQSTTAMAAEQTVRALVAFLEQPVSGADDNLFTAAVKAELAAPPPVGTGICDEGTVVEHERCPSTCERGKVFELIQRRPVAELRESSEVHVLWEVAPTANHEPEPEPERGATGAGDKWYCKSCYRTGLQWSPNWNDAESVTCGACGKERSDHVERSAWVRLGDLSAADQVLAKRKWAGPWQQVLWATCGDNWRVAGEASSSMCL